MKHEKKWKENGYKKRCVECRKKFTTRHYETHVCPRCEENVIGEPSFTFEEWLEENYR